MTRLAAFTLLLALLGGCATAHPKLVCFGALARMKDGQEQPVFVCNPVIGDKAKFIGESSP